MAARTMAGRPERTVDRTLRRPTANYRVLLSAFVVSTAGDALYRIALPLLVLEMTGSALTTAAVYSLEYLPYLLFAVFAGVVADRLDRRTLLVCVDTGAAVLIGGLAVLVLWHSQQLWMVYVIAFVLAASRPLYHAAFQGVIPRLVPTERLTWANSRLQAFQSLLDLVGPVLGAGAVAALGAAGALGLDSASFAYSALAISMIHAARAGRPAAQDESIAESFRAGFAFLRRQPTLLWGSVLTAGCAFGLFLVEANMIFYLIRFQGRSVATVALVFAALGAGSVLGAVVTPALSTRVRPGRLIVICMVVGGLATGSLLVLTAPVGIAVAWFVVGAASMIYAVTFFTLRHRLTPDRLLGRVVALTRVLGFSALPAAPLVGGLLLATTGQFAVVIAVAAGIQLGVGVLAMATPLYERDRPDAAAPAGEPATLTGRERL